MWAIPVLVDLVPPVLVVVFRLDLVVVFRLGPAVVFRLGPAVVFRLDPAVVFRLDPAVVFRLGPAVDFPPVLVVVALMAQAVVTTDGTVQIPTADKAPRLQFRCTVCRKRAIFQ